MLRCCRLVLETRLAARALPGVPALPLPLPFLPGAVGPGAGRGALLGVGEVVLDTMAAADADADADADAFLRRSRLWTV